MSKKLFLAVIFIFYILHFTFPKDAWGMLLREKSLRESFFTQLVDEIKLQPGQTLSQSVRFNYEKPLGIEIIFRNPSEQEAKGFLVLKDKQKILTEKEFFLKPNSPAGFVFFAFPIIKEARGESFWLEIINQGEIPLIVGYYNQNVYRYGNLYLGRELQPGVLQFQIHYQINPFQELVLNLKQHFSNSRLFFSLWLATIIFITFAVIILTKKL